MKRMLTLALLYFIAFMAGAQIQQGINAGMIQDAINKVYPGLVIGVSMPDLNYAVVDSWSPAATPEQRAQVQAYLAGLDFTLLNAQQVYDRNYAAFNAKTFAIEAAGFSYQDIDLPLRPDGHIQHPEHGPGGQQSGR